MTRTGLTTEENGPGFFPGAADRTVWVVHPINGTDISAASIWGEVRFINNRYVYPDELGSDNSIPADFMARLEAAANDFREGDSLVMVGDHVQFTILVYKLALLRKSFSLLRFDRHVNSYVPVKIG